MGSGDVGLCRLAMENTYDDFCLDSAGKQINVIKVPERPTGLAFAVRVVKRYTSPGIIHYIR
jgi:hypothetical protein